MDDTFHVWVEAGVSDNNWIAAAIQWGHDHYDKTSWLRRVLRVLEQLRYRKEGVKLPGPIGVCQVEVT